MSDSEKRFLLKLARDTIEGYLKNGILPRINESKLSKNLLRKQACFVTLNKHHMLRGCIGSLLPQEKLYECVIRNSINAALHDIRFKPVSYDELKDIEIEISLLTLPERLEYSDWQDLLNKLKPGIDGVILNMNNKQATFLPQVWGKIPNKELFLSELCMKAGLNYDCWKHKPDIYIYHAIVFAE